MSEDGMLNEYLQGRLLKVSNIITMGGYLMTNEIINCFSICKKN